MPDKPVLATVNINIGLGKDNPSLVIREGDHVPTLVNRLIDNYQLPKKVYVIIMERVSQELHIAPQTQNNHKSQFLKTSKIETESSVSPIKIMPTGTPKNLQTRRTPLGKENCENFSNLVRKDPKAVQKKSQSPLLKTSKTPTLKKIEIKQSKSPSKNSFSSVRHAAKSVKLNESTLKIQKLFKHLTKCNPSGIKILSPEHINLKGMDRGLLSELQQFFQCLQEQQFDVMNEQYFISRTEELAYTKKFIKKQYDYCYMQN